MDEIGVIRTLVRLLARSVPHRELDLLLFDSDDAGAKLDANCEVVDRAKVVASESQKQTSAAASDAKGKESQTNSNLDASVSRCIFRNQTYDLPQLVLPMMMSLKTYSTAALIAPGGCAQERAGDACGADRAGDA